MKQILILLILMVIFSVPIPAIASVVDYGKVPAGGGIGTLKMTIKISKKVSVSWYFY
jgi:hypothetical protein